MAENKITVVVNDGEQIDSFSFDDYTLDEFFDYIDGLLSQREAQLEPVILYEDNDNRYNDFTFTYKGNLYRITEGTGDNLLEEDEENGFVDYYNWEVYENVEDLEKDLSMDGGMLLLENFYDDMFGNEEQVIRHFMKNELGEEDYTIRRIR